MTSELHATKAAIMDELLGELEGRFATKTQLESKLSKAKAAHALRPTAPEFVPSHHSAGASPEAPATGGGAASHLQKPSCLIFALRGMRTSSNLRCWLM